LQLAVLRMDFQDVPGIQERTTELQAMIETAMTRVRDLSNDLNPSDVERSGLAFALERLIDRQRSLYPAGSRLHFVNQVRLPREIARAFYRVAEHALSVAAPRAQATQLDVELKAVVSGATMEIRFDGRAGVPSEGENPMDRIEMLALEQHLRRAGVTFRVESTVGSGTIVSTGYPRVSEEFKND
jgi:signal transduction histidine kinase